MRLQGAWTALITPMNSDLSLDREGLEKNVEFQISQGITGILPVGTTGESPTLTWDEHNEIVERVLRQCKGKCGTIAGTGSNSTAEAVASTRHAVDAGAEAVLLVDCYYNGPSSQELRDEYYGTVASEFPQTTVVPYVIPGRSGTALTVEDLAILSKKRPNVCAVKEATGDLERMAKTRSICGNNFSIMSGDDDITFKMMTRPDIRANGVISVTSNIVPGAVVKMAKLALEGDIDGATAMHNAIAPLLGVVTVKVDNERVMPSGEKVAVNDRYRNPLPYKTLMTGLGMPSGFCRKPLGRMSKIGVEKIRDAVKTVWEHNPEVLKPLGDFYGIDVAARLSDDSIWDSLANY